MTALGIIFMTGGAFARSARDFLARVPNPWLLKPFKVRELEELLTALLHQPRRTGPEILCPIKDFADLGALIATFRLGQKALTPRSRAG
ncbi:hypothetical protein [Archangium sp.]|uniref:hypothetical protein n=1 Tax=Archangium sp. TaxID=1872627 RepID=UPI002D411F72|nr:hypothetical protein [Archangium sp.]HYO56681.1 hypothetical protein [Archangium sp.]